jgi:hypothetical protein
MEIGERGQSGNRGQVPLFLSTNSGVRVREDAAPYINPRVGRRTIF